VSLPFIVRDFAEAVAARATAQGVMAYSGKGFGTKMNPYKILKDAITAVPSVKYALAVAGIVAAVSIVLVFIKDPAIAVYGIIIMIAFMFVLVIFTHAVRNIPGVRLLVAIVSWFIAFLFIVALVSVFTAFSFGYPEALASYFRSKPLPAAKDAEQTLSSSTTTETVPKCPGVDVWRPPLEAIKAFVPEGQDFYELREKLKSLKKARAEGEDRINDNPNSPELNTWKEGQSDIGREINKAEKTRLRLQDPVLDNLYEQLKKGTLVAKAYDRDKREQVCIHTDQWQFLMFNLGDEEPKNAGGQGTHYVGVQIGKAK